MKPDSPLNLTARKKIKASAARVFEAWTTPSQVTRWLGPGSCEVLSAEIDLRPGGSFLFRFLMHGEESSVKGVYREIVPHSRLVFTWQHASGPQKEFGETLVAVDFAETAGVTEITVKHTGFTDRSACENHTTGWRGALQNLAALVPPKGKRKALNSGTLHKQKSRPAGR
jgi:uncharacterized protein YndB with AHSA1/START domain